MTRTLCLRRNKDAMLAVLASVALIGIMLLSMMPVNAAGTATVIYGPAKISSGGDEETPQIVIDHRGNVHIVWSSNNGRHLIYMMFDPNGNVLIDETILDPAEAPQRSHARRPSMAVDSNNNIHIVFHGFYHYTDFTAGEYQSTVSLDASEVMYVKINPYLDDRDGSPADPAVIVMIPEKIISTNDGVKSRAPNIAIGGHGYLHVAWFDGDIWSAQGEIHYLKMNTNGNIVVSETTVASDFYTDGDWSEPEIVADSYGNAHVFFVTEGWTGDTYDWRDIWYLMVSGSDGSVLIAPTQLTQSGGEWRNTRPAVAIDSRNIIHIVYHNGSNTIRAELFLFRMNPYLDDRDGSPADPATIIVSGPMQLTETDGYRSYLKDITIDEWGREHIVWVDQRDMGSRPPWGSGELYYTLPGEVPETRITFFNGEVYPAYWWYSSGRKPEITVGDLVFITFNGYNITDDNSYIYFMVLRVPTAAVGGTALLPYNKAIDALLTAATLIAITGFITLAKSRKRTGV